MLTPGENYYRLFEGKMPEYVPLFEFFPLPGVVPATMICGPSALSSFHGPEGGLDPWGVEYLPDAVNGGAAPKTWDFILDDIDDWEKVIKNPDIDDLDWKTMSEQDLQASVDFFGLDRNQTLLLGATSAGFFQDLMGFMGFTNGLCAMIESPDKVKALFEYILQYYLNLQHNLIKYYSPDAIYILDDSAAKNNPFVSRDMFCELLLPFYKAIVDDALDHGLPVQYHNCGRCEDFMEDIVGLGITIWDPVQTTNDIVAMKEKFGRKLALAGCWDWKLPPAYPEVDEAMVRKMVRDTIDTYAPGGGFAIGGGAVIMNDSVKDQASTIQSWYLDEVLSYGSTFYKNNPQAV